MNIAPIATGPSGYFDGAALPPTPDEPDVHPASVPVSPGVSFYIGPPSPGFPMSPRTSGGEGAPGFAPHYMGTDQPKAPELQWPSGPRAAHVRPKRSMWSPIAAAFGYQSGGTPPEPADDAGVSLSLESLPPRDSDNAGTRIKRSLSTLLQRSSSVLRRGDAGSRSPQRAGTLRRGHSTQNSVSAPRKFMRSTSPTPPPTGLAGSPCSEPGPFTTSDVAGSLAASQFYVSPASTAVSPLIGNSMVHVKVIMDEDTVVVVPILRMMVFARARERILTKLFQGGVSLVESKGRTLAVRRADGSMMPITDNPTWRALMDVAARAHQQQQAKASGPGAAWPDVLRPCTRTVAKLTLHLTSPAAA
ncbi:hypothetical protein H4R19_003693 [Coemansia spiralis]|nr:hypothetical protein H4R19_003693 [Coemansia spiralis]